MSRSTEHSPGAGREQTAAINQRQYDAIHRSVLTGLLGNVGTRSDNYEYLGARGTKFNIFPGSGLFKRKPPWVVSAELVETTRLYARTVAQIRPEWIERIASHLVARTYSEPHWQVQTLHVVAYEKVTLYGLVLVPRRLVHYGPIEPKISREIFIHHALAEGEFKTDAPFFRHNRELTEQIRTLEAKARRRDLLADVQSRYAFFDARVPSGIYNGPLFEKWRREAEKEQPELLFMSRADLLTSDAQDITPERYPDAFWFHGARLKLEYKFEPGDPADGVTVVIPLAALNQVSEGQLTWLVPGMIEEKIEALIRTLPKSLRITFVPVPDMARDAAASLKPSDEPLENVLAEFLGKRSGLPVRPFEFDASSLPEYLRMNFRVVDPNDKTLAMGRNLAEIRRKLAEQAKEMFRELPTSQWNRDDVRTWDFGELLERVEVKRFNLVLHGYPALVEKGDSVSLRLMDSAQAAASAMRTGLRRLLMNQMAGEIKYLGAHLPQMDKSCLYYAPLGNCDELRGEIMLVASDRVFVDDLPPIRTREAFDRRLDGAFQRLSAASSETANLVNKILSAWHALTIDLAKSWPPLMQPAVADMKQQLAHLVYRGFVEKTPPAWLVQMPRFFTALESRRSKLTNAGLARDSAAMDEITPLWRQYFAKSARHRELGIADPELEQYRWMLEEFRVSLFAQELKTSIPISAKRLETQWERTKP